MYCTQYQGPVTEPEQLHPQSDKSGFPLIPPIMFFRSAFLNFLAFFIMLNDLIGIKQYSLVTFQS